MSLSRQTLKRLPTIKAGFRKGSSYEEIATLCEVHHRTIERDVQSWVQSGQFETWIRQEFIDLHGYARNEDKMEAYKEIAKLVGKMITRKIESKHTEEIKDLQVHIIKVDRKSLEDESTPRVANARRTA